MLLRILGFGVLIAGGLLVAVLAFLAAVLLGPVVFAHKHSARGAR